MPPAMTRLLFAASMSPMLGCRLRNRMLRALGVGVRPDTKISRGTRLGGADIRFGAGCGANEECWIDDHVSFGSRVRLGPRVMILTASHPIGPPEQRRGWPDTTRPVSIGDGAWIQAGATILPGANVAAGCIVCAGAVLTASTEPHGMYAGVPARRIRELAA